MWNENEELLVHEHNNKNTTEKKANSNRTKSEEKEREKKTNNWREIKICIDRKSSRGGQKERRMWPVNAKKEKEKERKMKMLSDMLLAA